MLKNFLNNSVSLTSSTR